MTSIKQKSELLKWHKSAKQWYRSETDPDTRKRKFTYYGRELAEAERRYLAKVESQSQSIPLSDRSSMNAASGGTGKVGSQSHFDEEPGSAAPAGAHGVEAKASVDLESLPKWFTLLYHKGKGQFYRRLRCPLTGKRKMFYYGSDWAEAWSRYCDHQPELQFRETAAKRDEANKTGRPIDALPADSNVKRLAGAWRKLQTERFNTMQAGKRVISPSTFAEYCRVADALVAELGNTRIKDLQAQDFMRWQNKMNGAMATISRRITIVRQIFAYGQEQHRIPQPYYGDRFSQSSIQKLQNHRTKPLELFEPEQIRALLYYAPALLRASVLLGINAGFYAVDVSELRINDIEGNLLDHLRHKSGVRRMAILWPETLSAMKQAKRRNREGRWFMNQSGKPLVTQYVNAEIVCPECHYRHESRRIQGDSLRCEKCKQSSGTDKINLVNVRNHSQDYVRDRFVRQRREVIRTRPEVGMTSRHKFKFLRHTYATIAQELRDKDTLRLTMGHADSSVLNSYLLTDAQPDLQKLSDHVRDWMFTKACSKCGQIDVQSANIWRCDGCSAKNMEFSRIR